MLWQQKVLLIVPHQDDEINVLGGILKSLSNMVALYTSYMP